MSSFASFNGTYKRTPTVSFRGSTKTESREQLLERAQKERLKREVCFDLQARTSVPLKYHNLKGSYHIIFLSIWNYFLDWPDSKSSCHKNPKILSRLCHPSKTPTEITFRIWCYPELLQKAVKGCKCSECIGDQKATHISNISLFRGSTWWGSNRKSNYFMLIMHWFYLTFRVIKKSAD